MRFFEQAHIKDVAAFIRFVASAMKSLQADGAITRTLLAGRARTIYGAWETALEASGEIASRPRDYFRMAANSKTKKSWVQLAYTLDEIAPAGQPNPPSEMIMSVVETVYDDYAKANFSNYELRREDLNQLAAFRKM